LSRAEGVDEIGIADHEADAPARHVVALGQREELHAHVLRARHLHDRGRLVAVEHEVGVSEVVHHVDAVLARHLHHVLEERRSTHCAVGLLGKLSNSILGLGQEFLMALSSSSKKSTPGTDRHVADVGTGDHEAVGVDRVGGIGHQHSIAAVDRRHGEMSKAFLRTDGDDGFLVGVEVDVVARLVPVADRKRRRRGMPRDTE
jgi:hypothetical protein